MPEMIRTFIAIELDDATHRALASVQNKLKRERAAQYVRWVAPDSIHITLKFLGDVDAEQIPALQRAVSEACAGTPPFTLTLAGVGAFPNTNRPNVVWVGASGQVDIITQLAKRIEDACITLGFAREERAFSPHLTLGRVKRDATPRDRQAVGEMVTNAKTGTVGEWHVARVIVMKSELRPTGSVYTRLLEIELKA